MCSSIFKIITGVRPTLKPRGEILGSRFPDNHLEHSFLKIYIVLYLPNLIHFLKGGRNM